MSPLKLLTACLIALGTLSVSLPASADRGEHRGHHKHWERHDHRHRHHDEYRYYRPYRAPVAVMPAPVYVPQPMYPAPAYAYSRDPAVVIGIPPLVIPLR